jgi:flagellar basal-body rod protein FlgB
MIFADIVNRGTLPVLEKLMAYTEARQRVLAENVANIDNPHYRTKQLDAKAFQRSLREAIDRQQATGSPAFELQAGDDFSVDSDGYLQVSPTERPADNVLFHDDTNTSVEKQMAMMAENGMTHEAATELLRTQFDSLRKAIRGQN